MTLIQRRNNVVCTVGVMLAPHRATVWPICWASDKRSPGCRCCMCTMACALPGRIRIRINRIAFIWAYQNVHAMLVCDQHQVNILYPPNMLGDGFDIPALENAWCVSRWIFLCPFNSSGSAAFQYMYKGPILHMGYMCFMWWLGQVTNNIAGVEQIIFKLSSVI